MPTNCSADRRRAPSRQLDARSRLWLFSAAAQAAADAALPLQRSNRAHRRTNNCAMHDDRRAQLAEPLLSTGVVRKTSEGSVSKRLSSSSHRIESHRHRHEAVYRKGTALREREKVAYDFKSPVAFPVGEMREFAGPSPVENPESAEELATRSSGSTRCRRCTTSHLHPVPHSVHELLTSSRSPPPSSSSS